MIRHVEKTYNRRNNGNKAAFLLFTMTLRRGIHKNPSDGRAPYDLRGGKRLMGTLARERRKAPLVWPKYMPMCGG